MKKKINLESIDPNAKYTIREIAIIVGMNRSAVGHAANGDRPKNRLRWDSEYREITGPGRGKNMARVFAGDTVREYAAAHARAEAERELRKRRKLANRAKPKPMSAFERDLIERRRQRGEMADMMMARRVKDEIDTRPEWVRERPYQAPKTTWEV